MFKRSSFVAALALTACVANGSSDAADNASASNDVTSASGPSTPRTVIASGADNLARAGDTIFYTDFVNIEVRSVPVAGGASKVLWKGRTQPMDQLGAIAVDERDLFFVEDGQILRIPQSGGRWDILVRNATDFPGDIALDDRFVYWTSGSLDHAVIRRVAKEGGAPETIYDGPRGGNGLEVKDGFVYFFGGDRSVPAGADKSQYLMKVEAKPNATATAIELARIENGAREITMSGDEIYFANKSGEPASWGVRAVSKNGGAIRTVASLGESNDLQPYSLSAAGNSLYWSQSMTFDWQKSPPGQHDAKIFTVATSGTTPPKELASNLDGAPLLALSDNACPVWGGRFEIATLDICQ